MFADFRLLGGLLCHTAFERLSELHLRQSNTCNAMSLALAIVFVCVSFVRCSSDPPAGRVDHDCALNRIESNRLNDAFVRETSEQCGAMEWRNEARATTQCNDGGDGAHSRIVFFASFISSSPRRIDVESRSTRHGQTDTH